jgi:large subunit ribosomal protein L4
MFEVPVYNTAGEKVRTIQIADDRFGTAVNVALLKQAVVAYHANKRQGTFHVKARNEVEGSTRKLYRQKGTGNARRGAIRTPIMRGGGRAFGKDPRDFRQALPRKMRKAALNSAILAKILGDDLLVVEGLKLDAPKTKTVAGVLAKLNINRSCLLALAGYDEVLFKSARNIPAVTVREARELNAFEVATRQKMLVTAEAMDMLLGKQA